MKMTEREFRKRLFDEAGINVVSQYSDVAVAVAREAGLEFASEPPLLPAELSLDARGFIQPRHLFGWDSDKLEAELAKGPK